MLEWDEKEIPISVTVVAYKVEACRPLTFSRIVFVIANSVIVNDVRDIKTIVFEIFKAFRSTAIAELKEVASNLYDIIGECDCQHL